MKGVEVVKADYDNRETIKAALEGAYGVFLITNGWQNMDADKEIAQVITYVSTMVSRIWTVIKKLL